MVLIAHIKFNFWSSFMRREDKDTSLQFSDLFINPAWCLSSFLIRLTYWVGVHLFFLLSARMGYTLYYFFLPKRN